MTDLEILATAQISSPQAAARDKNELVMMEFVMRAAKMSGKHIHLVSWPNGPALMVDEDPHDKAAWNALIVQGYRAAEAGYRGPVCDEVAK